MPDHIEQTARQERLELLYLAQQEVITTTEES